MKTLILMIQFMTRYPIPMVIDFSARRLVAGMKWMPLVGLLISLPAAIAMAALAPLFGQEVAAFAAVIVLIAVTGGLHLDGLADTADGLFSCRPRERMLEIMRDSTLGTHGVTAIVLAVLGKYILLKTLPTATAVLALLCAPVIGRMALVWHSAVSSYARSGPGIGDYVDQTGLPQAAAASLLSLLIVSGLSLWWLEPLSAVLAVTFLHGAAILLAVFFAFRLRRILGGITGDTVGATIELAELATLSLFLLLAKLPL